MVREGVLQPTCPKRSVVDMFRASLSGLFRPLRYLLRHELADAERRRSVLHEKLEASRARLARVESNLRRAQSRRPSDTVLWDVLPLRHQALLERPCSARDSEEAAFAGRCESYRDARLSGAPPTATRRRLGPLTWWVPCAAAEHADEALNRPAYALALREILDSRELATGQVMLDIGANVGATSIPRVILGDFARVYAVEPHPVNYACLVRNIVDNGLGGLVLPDRVALGDTEGTMHLRLLSSRTHHLLASPGNGIDVVEVRSTTLDRWVNQLGVDLSRVSFVKTDTQGWDARVLLGARDVLARRHIAWQIEFSPSMLDRSGYDQAFTMDLIRSHFSHFIDTRATTGRRARPTRELPTVLEDLVRRQRSFTNLLLYNAAP